MHTERLGILGIVERDEEEGETRGGDVLQCYSCFSGGPFRQFVSIFEKAVCGTLDKCSFLLRERKGKKGMK